MRNFFTILILISCFTNISHAQTNLSDTLSTLYSNISQLKQDFANTTADLQKLKNANGSYSNKLDSLNNMNKELLQLKQEVAKNYAEVLKLTDKDLRSAKKRFETNKSKILNTAFFLSAADNSLSVLNTALKIEDYRTKVASLNNPTSSDLGFNLESELSVALKPILEKVKNTDKPKFVEIINNIVTNPLGTKISSFVPAAGVIQSVLNLVYSVILKEKKVTPQDFISFHEKLNKFFVHYEKLANINQALEYDLAKLSVKADAVSVLIKQFAIDRAATLNSDARKNVLEEMSLEKILLDYYDAAKIPEFISDIVQAQPRIVNKPEPDYEKLLENPQLQYPVDGAFISKEIASEIEKIFKEYEIVFKENYENLTKLVADSKNLTANVDTLKLNNTLAELRKRYNESSEAKALNSKLLTLYERLAAIPMY